MANNLVAIKPPMPPITLSPSQERLREILTWKRPQGSKAQKRFNRDWLAPVFGAPDAGGNYTLTIGESPIVFTAHHDTVHRAGGRQRVELDGATLRLAKDELSNCLGADCGTGVWLILEMIRERVPGRYAIFSEEESGCIGSEWLVSNRPDFYAGAKAVISFDRKGTKSIITHQSSWRTCTDDFAESLSDILGLGMQADDGGSYTDSNEFKNVVGECTNVSVGYYSQHTWSESQDMAFALDLRNALIEADWDQLRFSRKPGEKENLWRLPRRASRSSSTVPTTSNFQSRWDDDWRTFGRAETEYEKLVRLVRENPAAVADYLEQQGVDAAELALAIGDFVFGGSR